MLEFNKNIKIGDRMIGPDYPTYIIAEIGGKPEERTKEYYDNRPCAVIVYNTAKILEDYLIAHSIIK